MFSPNDLVTREQIATMLHIMSERGLIDASLTFDPDALDRSPDAGAMASWASESLSLTVTHNIIHGVNDTYLDPQGYSSRAAMATMAANILS